MESVKQQSAPGRYLILFAVTFLLLALRKPDSLINPQFWAEDGVQFFYTQAVYGTWPALIRTHAGYLHLIPRLVAAGSSLFPARLAPLLYNSSALAIAAWCCTTFSLPRYRPLLQSDSQRILLCLLMATGFYADELVGTITNVQWFLFVPALLILVSHAAYDPRSPGRVEWVEAVLIFLIGLTAPLLAILLPVACWIAWRRRQITLVPAALVLATLIQTGVTLLRPSSDRPSFVLSPGELVKSSAVTFDYRVVLSSVAGHRVAKAISDAGMGGFAVLVLLLVIAVLAKAFWDLGSSQRRRFAMVIYLLVASLLLAMSGRALAKVFLSFSRLPQWRHERYFFAGACLFAWLVAICIERWCGRERPVVAALVLLAVFGGGLRNNFKVDAFPDYAWAAYAPAIDRWSRAVRSRTAVAGFAVPINPSPIEIQFPAYTPGPRGTEFSPHDRLNVAIPVRPIAANGNPTKVGIFRSGFFWLLDVDGNGEFKDPPDRAFAFGGIAGDIPITGDWSGSGRTNVGVYRSSSGLFLLDYDGDGKITAADKTFSLGVGIQADDVPVTGDWNGDGRTKVGLFRQRHLWLLDYDGNGTFEKGVDRSYEFGGVPGDVPVVGDWNGSGSDKIGLVRRGIFWVLDANGNGQFDGIGKGRDVTFPFRGLPGDIPVAGDWNGDGRSKPGLFRLGVWILDRNGNYRYDGVGKGQDLTFSFGGVAGDKPVVGKW